MPRAPHRSSVASSVSGSVFSALAHKLNQFDGEVYPLHVGDTWLDPMEGARLEDFHSAEMRGLNRYSSTVGDSRLIDAIVEKTRARTRVPVHRGNILVTASATAGLNCLVRSIVEPGEEVLILAPYWPLIAGIVRVCGATPVAVPVLGLNDPEEVASRVESRLTERTAALYLSTPNNPTGDILETPVLEALAELSRCHDLWLVTDDVYEDYVYRGETGSCLPLAPERTVACYSFSKAYGMAGYRCGYLVGPEEVISGTHNVSTHTFYSAPTTAQLAGEFVLQHGDDWLADAREQYREIGDRVASRLGVDKPRGGTFLFLDLEDSCEDGSLFDLLERMADRGLLLAPGPSFGPFEHHARLSFTAATPESTLRGVEVLAEILKKP